MAVSRFGLQGKIPVSLLLCSDIDSTVSRPSAAPVAKLPVASDVKLLLLSRESSESEGKAADCRKRWLPWEDEVVRSMVDKQGPRRWGDIAARIPGRNANQVRLRWCLYLRPDIQKSEFSAELDAMLLQLQTQHGNNWKLIGQQLGTNHSINDVKNRYHALCRRKAQQQQLVR